MGLKEEINKRRTFAIISHPDAGKTTLTEKILLFGGAIQTAGAVKSNKITKSATSDFLEIERQRGISVSTSVMGFFYKDHQINILDTPGHKDFAEDTYRTLTAVDSVILVVDCVKGVEEQTERLMKVCRMRNTPVIIFINKLDREGRDPYDLLEELEEKLSISVRPLSWPIGMGNDLKGVYNLYEKKINLFSANKTSLAKDVISINDINDPEIDSYVGERHAKILREDVDVIEDLYENLDISLYREGLLAPVFFGSAISSFGVRELLDTFIDIAPVPLPRPTDERNISPEEKNFSGFVFKIHANLDPKHRDRIAFCRICSGKFERNKFYYHTRLKKKIRFSNPTSFMANDRSVIDEAWPGDVVGLYDSGNFKIGDTLTEGEEFFFKGIPNFSPELFKEIVNEDPFKTKQLEKGVEQLTDEGVAQLFTFQPGNRKVIGTVGDLQFDVIQFRLKHEYGASCSFRHVNYYKAYWITSKNPAALKEFMITRGNNIGFDKEENPVFFAESEWISKVVKEKHPDVELHQTSEFNT
ncbi:MAG: peptide chain release factor 3 [Cytophagaceae bacterium]